MLELFRTSDGSTTYYHTELQEHYHSKNGALQEAQHVFVNAGLVHFSESNPLAIPRILEIGFGTGLNALLSMQWALENKRSLHYFGIEKFPLNIEQIIQTGYQQYVDPALWSAFVEHYERRPYELVELQEGIFLQLFPLDLISDNLPTEPIDIVYFDAFAPSTQAEMWSADAISRSCAHLKDKGIFVTYSVTGELKRILRSLGFSIERLPGAAGKREMMRATKN